MQRQDYIRLKNNLNKLCKFLDDLYSINEGGCCFLCSLIAEHLEKLSVSYELIVDNDRIKNIDDVIKEYTNCKLNKSNATSISGRNTCNHYFINIKNIGYVNEIDDERKYRYKFQEITYKQIKWIYRRGDWNDFYDKSNNRTIKSIVNAFFKEYEK